MVSVGRVKEKYVQYTVCIYICYRFIVHFPIGSSKVVKSGFTSGAVVYGLTCHW